MVQIRTLPSVEGTVVHNGRYHLKMHIPYAIREFYGNKPHVRRSLKTADPRQAEQAVTLQRTEFHQKEQEKERLANRPKLVDALRPDQRRLFDDAGGLEGLLNAFQKSQTALAFARVGHPDTAHAVAGQDYEPSEPVEPLTARLEEAQDWAAYEVLRADAVAEGKTLKALGQRVKIPGEVFGLGELADVYADEKKQPTKTKGNFATVVRRFIEFHSDIALEDLTLTHLRDYGKAVLTLPKHTSSAKLRGLSMPELIRIADAAGLDRVGTTTRDKDLSILKALTSFGKDEGYMPANPWKGYSAVTAKGKYAHRGKPCHPFKPDQVRVIQNYAAGNRDARTVDRWAPLLGVYQGARIEEICQMRGDDVYQVGDTWVMRITDEAENQKGKNASSYRVIPLHDAAIKAGFLNYAKDRSGPQPLFQEFAGRSQRLVDVRPDTDGRMAGHYGKRFGRMLRKEIGITDKTRTFHSFCHTWEDAAGDVEMYQTHRKMLAGRSGEEGSQDGYGDGAMQKNLAVSLNKINPMAERE